MEAVRKLKSEDDKHAKIIRLLLAHPRIDVNKQDRRGVTAAHKANYYGVLLLLGDQRFDVNLATAEGETVLMARCCRRLSNLKEQIWKTAAAIVAKL